MICHIGLFGNDCNLTREPFEMGQNGKRYRVSWAILGWKLSRVSPKHPIKKLASQILTTLFVCHCIMKNPDFRSYTLIRYKFGKPSPRSIKNSPSLSLSPALPSEPSNVGSVRSRVALSPWRRESAPVSPWRRGNQKTSPV